MKFDEFIKKYLGKKVDWDKAYEGQCVDLFRQYCHDVLNINQPRGVVGAADFWDNFETDPVLKENFDRIKNTPSGLPVFGDVMLWDRRKGKGFGHVALFIEGDLNTFTSFDQNWPTLSKCTKTVHDYSSVIGWIHPKNNGGGHDINVSGSK
jgi:hypothetical protein